MDGASYLNADGARRAAQAVAQCVGEVVRPGKGWPRDVGEGAGAEQCQRASA